MRAKDAVIASLTADLAESRSEAAALEAGLAAREDALDARAAHMQAALADRFYRSTLLRKTLRALHLAVESTWRRRVERACQARAEAVCAALRQDLGTHNALLTEQLAAARAEIAALQELRAAQEERMRQAFLRGVSALNTEAAGLWRGAPAARKPEVAAAAAPAVPPPVAAAAPARPPPVAAPPPAPEPAIPVLQFYAHRPAPLAVCLGYCVDGWM